MLAVFVIIAAVVAIGATGVAFVQSGAAQATLAQATAETTSLLGQEQQYQSVTAIAGQLATVQQTETSASASEILWQPVFAKISVMLPPGCSIVAGTFKSPAAWEPALQLLGPTRNAHIGSLTLVIDAPNAAVAQPLLARLRSLPGFADATEDAAALDPSRQGYFVGYTIELNSSALANRFPANGAGSTGTSTSPSPSPTPAPTPTTGTN
jgi:hypothetical protein